MGTGGIAMKIIDNIIIYDEAETAFIDTLSEEAKKNIHRGLATPYDYGMKSRVTLDEDKEEYEFESVYDNIQDYYQKLYTYNEFEKNLTHYILYNSHADETVFKLWKAFEQNIAKATDSDTMCDNKACLITWLECNWGAFLECILDGSFRYMNVASLVLDSWNEFCE